MRTLDRVAALIAAALFPLLAAFPGQVHALDSGLEVSGYRNLYVVIEKLSPDAQRIGLTDTVVRNRVELRLRAAGIKPVGTLERADYLYVMIGVVGAAFSVEVTFDRSVTYFDGASMREAAAATWSKSFLGTHGFNATYILGGVDQVLNDFLNAYLRANQ